ncbi:MAG: MBOAT family protein [Oscillospiraceae bacterium]|nr:MBOAT family protein [Oscillospiraceae bacterium]
MALHAAIFLFFFFPPVFLLHTVLPGRRGKNGLLLAASLIFYAFGQWQGIPILLLSAAVSYGAGALMGRAGTGKPLLVLALALQLGLLGCFKYLNFLVSILNGALALELSGAVLPLPVGISFFTFKAMAYTIDAYRSGGGEKRRFSDVLLYISFFPQITSGPITRFDQFAPQLARRHTSAEQAAKGLRRFIVGMAKKLLIAGPVAAVADSAFALGGALDVRMAWLGATAYMVQLYIDFSGYSDMAIGMAAMFGFETPENFDYPYLAASVTDFWRRWHISLSSWFRDYLYIPLGGNRRGRARAALNKAAVFLLCGVWHGAGWTFLLWRVARPALRPGEPGRHQLQTMAENRPRTGGLPYLRPAGGLPGLCGLPGREPDGGLRRIARDVHRLCPHPGLHPGPGAGQPGGVVRPDGRHGGLPASGTMAGPADGGAAAAGPVAGNGGVLRGNSRALPAVPAGGGGQRL